MLATKTETKLVLFDNKTMLRFTLHPTPYPLHPPSTLTLLDIAFTAVTEFVQRRIR